MSQTRERKILPIYCKGNIFKLGRRVNEKEMGRKMCVSNGNLARSISRKPWCKKRFFTFFIIATFFTFLTFFFYFAQRFYARKQLLLSARLSHRNSVRLSVCPSVTRVDQSKTVQARIIKSSPSGAWKTLYIVSGTVKLFHKFKGGYPERGR